MFDSLMKNTREAVLAFSAGRYGDVLQATEGVSNVSANVLAGLAATALGRLADARRILAEADSDPAATALAHIAQGNLDQLCGRLSDAFFEYEIGLHLALKEGFDDIVVFGRTWRDLALARFGDHAAVDDLQEIAKQARHAGRKDDAERAAAFCAAGSVIIGKPVPEEIQALASTFEAGRKALVLGSAMLAHQAVDLDSFIDAIMRSEAVEGAPELIVQAIEQYKIKALSTWAISHAKPFADFIAKDDASIFPSLPDEPRMTPMDCARCDGRCCYDGVYVTGPEEDLIRLFMKRYPSYFKDVPEVFLEPGEWGFLFHGKRTLRVPHSFSRPDFPRHFTRTKCVFALPSGECSLQKAATDQLYHPWKVKPELCWEFPLIGLFNDNAMEKPHYFGEPDPGFYDENQPGYLSFMPCARVKPDGASWKRMYRTEFLHYFKTKGIKR